MFEKQIRLTGKHATILRKYSHDKQGTPTEFLLSNNEENSTPKPKYVFESMLQCFMVATMIGIIENKTVKTDNSTNDYATIFADILNKQRSNLDRIYRHIVFTEGIRNGQDIDATVKKAFTTVSEENEKIEMEQLENYTRGGLEIIDSYFYNCQTFEDLANAVYDLSQKYNLRIND